MNSIDILNHLTERWEKSGLKRGDTFLLHSNMKRLLLEFKKKNLKIDLDLIIKSFLNVIGDEGTIIFPFFNFDFVNKNSFCINTSPSRMGALSEYFRKNFSVLRTGHPVYSFGVLGKKKNLFENVDNFSAYSEDSPFGILKNINGKIAILDLDDQSSMTFYHHIEESNNVDWRYFKKFKGTYINKKNKVENKEYAIFVRKIKKNIITFVNPAGELLWKEGLYVGSRPFLNTGLRVIECKQMFDFITNIIQSGKAENILYKINKS